jgi:hypothetical protein
MSFRRLALPALLRKHQRMPTPARPRGWPLRRCNFAHGEHELRRPGQQGLPSNFRTVVCKFWRDGYCRVSGFPRAGKLPLHRPGAWRWPQVQPPLRRQP